MTYRIRILAAVTAPLAALLATQSLMPTAQAREYSDPDRRACVSTREFGALGNFNNIRRDVIEERFEVKALDLDANDYVDPDNPHLYPVAYKVCGYNPVTEQILVINYRTTSDAWVWAFKLNRDWPLPAPHGRP